MSIAPGRAGRLRNRGEAARVVQSTFLGAMVGPAHEDFRLLSAYLPRHLVKSRLQGQEIAAPWVLHRTGTILVLDFPGVEPVWQEVARGGEVGLRRHRALLERLYGRVLEGALFRFDGMLARGDARRLVCVFPGRQGRGASDQRVEPGELRFSAQRALSCALRMLAVLGEEASSAAPRIGIAGGRVWEAVLGAPKRGLHLFGGAVGGRARDLAVAAPAGRALVEPKLIRSLEGKAVCEEHSSGSLLLSLEAPERDSDRPPLDVEDTDARTLERIMGQLATLLPATWEERLRNGEDRAMRVRGAVVRLEAHRAGESDPAAFQPWLKSVLEEAKSSGAEVVAGCGVARNGIAVLAFKEGAEDAEAMAARLTRRAPEGFRADSRTTSGEFLLAGIGCEERKLLFLEPLPGPLRLG